MSLPFRRSLPTLATAVLLLVALLGAPAASADGPPPAQVSLTAPASGKAGLAAPFTITVLDAASAPIANAPVTLEKQTTTGWVLVTSGTTDATGHVVLGAVIPEGVTTWRATYAGDSVNGAASSAPLNVYGVRYSTRLLLTAPSRVVDEHSVTLALLWTASDTSPVSAPVTLYHREGTGPWTTYRTLRTDATGRVAVTISPRVDSSWRAVGGSGSWWGTGTSVVHAIDNVPQGVPAAYPVQAPRPAYTPPQARATRPGAAVTVSQIPTSLWRSMVGRTWHAGCPVGRSSLRLLRVNYWGFDGYRYRGEMVLSSAVVYRAGAAFRDMYDGHFPIRRMYREDRFGWSSRLHGANDYASMRADNTSGFNCRSVVNRPSVLSPHARGRAIDINTWENPYRSATGLVPDSWWASHSDARIAWRSSSHPVVRIWRSHGFRWTYANVDSQHLDGRTAPLLGGFTG